MLHACFFFRPSPSGRSSTWSRFVLCCSPLSRTMTRHQAALRSAAEIHVSSTVRSVCCLLSHCVMITLEDASTRYFFFFFLQCWLHCRSNHVCQSWSSRVLREPPGTAESISWPGDSKTTPNRMFTDCKFTRFLRSIAANHANHGRRFWPEVGRDTFWEEHLSAVLNSSRRTINNNRICPRSVQTPAWLASLWTKATS